MARSADIKTPLARLAFTQSLFKARAGEDGGQPKFGCSLLFPKATDLTALKEAAVAVAVEEWGEKAKKMIADGLIKSPFLDGDGKQGKSKQSGETHAGFAGMTFIRVTSGADYKPKVVDRNVNVVTDPADCPSGYWGYGVVNAFTWENDKNGKGVTFGISLIQVAKKDEILGGTGGADPDKHFEKIDDEGDAPAETKSGKGAGGLFA